MHQLLDVFMRTHKDKQYEAVYDDDDDDDPLFLLRIAVSENYSPEVLSSLLDKIAVDGNLGRHNALHTIVNVAVDIKDFKVM